MISESAVQVGTDRLFHAHKAATGNTQS